MNALFARLREPSTWAAIATLATVVGHPLPAGWLDAAPTLVGLAGAVAAAVLPEGKAA